MNIDTLKWQVDMGANEVISEKSVNRLVEIKKTQKAKKSRPVSATPLEAVQTTRDIADQCNTIKELEAAVRNFDGLSIKKTATNTVFSDGNPNAKIMFIGEAPGANEDLEGIPFCGASGKLLDTLLEWAGISRKSNMYITNTVFWRPPGNRKPTSEEIAICKPFVERHIALIDPKIIVLIGSTATSSLLDTKIGISRLRRDPTKEKYHEYTNKYMTKPIPAAILFHPSYLLRQPGQKRFFWKDLLSMKWFIKENFGEALSN